MNIINIVSLIADICDILGFVISLFIANSVMKICKVGKNNIGKAKNSSIINQAGRDIKSGDIEVVKK